MARLGFEPGVIEGSSGIRTRYFADPGTQPSALATAAATEALEHAGWRAADVDLLIYAAVSRDQAEPATAHLVQNSLGASNAHVFDLSNACTSMLDALAVADSMLAMGRAKRAIVCSAELGSRVVRATIEKARELRSAAEFMPYHACLTLGDAGAAFALSTCSDGAGVLHWERFSHSSAHQACVLPSIDEPMMTDSEVLIRIAGKYGTAAVQRLLAHVGWDPADVDVVLTHQISLRVHRSMMRACGFPMERVSTVVHRYGNTAATMVGLATYEAWSTGQLQAGRNVVLAGVGSGVSGTFAAVRW